jgi:cytoskeletal protein RodZ
MSSVAEQLRQARQSKGLTIEQVAETTKIRGDHIRALEAGNFELFSAPVYVRGFIRTYSALLKLNVPELMQALDLELGQIKKFRDAGPLSSHKHGLLDWVMLQLSKLDLRVTLIVLGAVIVLGASAGGWMVWRHHRAKDPLAGMKPGLYQSPQKSHGETLPLPLHK